MNKYVVTIRGTFARLCLGTSPPKEEDIIHDLEEDGFQDVKVVDVSLYEEGYLN